MTLSMYQACVPVFIRGCENLLAVLDKAEAYAEAKGFDPAVLVQARLAPDMFPLVRQVQIMSDAAKGCAARLAGVEVPSFPDTEQSIPELKERIRKTLDFLRGISPEQMEGSETRDIHIKTPSRELDFMGLEYMQQFAVPNFYFHFTATYAILRHNGVELGKRDFLGK